MPHCAGRKSFVRHRAEKAVNGVEPSRPKVFINFHKDRKTKDKKKIDEESAQVVELMKEKLAELPNGVEERDGQIAWKCDVFDQVINKQERHGQVRGVGLGVCPSKLWSQSSISQTDLQNDDTSNEHIEKVIEERLKVIQENHHQEIIVLQQKNEIKLKKMLDRQSHLQGNMARLISWLTEKALNEEQTDMLSESVAFWMINAKGYILDER